MTTKLYEIGIDLFTSQYVVDVKTYNNKGSCINTQSQSFPEETDCLDVAIETLRVRNQWLKRKKRELNKKGQK